MLRINKFNIFFLLLIICSYRLSAQDVSVYLSPGLINYGGDLQNKVYTTSNAGFSIGGGIAYRVNKVVLRAAFVHGKIKSSDSASATNTNRNLSFESGINEASLSLEYDFFSLDNKKFTPYVFGGAAVFGFNPYTWYNGSKVYLKPLSTEGQGLTEYPDKKPYSLTQFAVPLGIGFKYKLSENFQVGVEFCSRFLFTDYLDDVSTTYPDENVLLKDKGQLAVDLSYRGDEVNPAQPFPSGDKRGNAGQNDNYYTSSLTLIYVFPKGAEFGGTADNHKKVRGINCPKL